jgi:hypothetical protein
MISKLYATEVYPIPTCDVMRQLSQIPETTFLPMRASLDPFSLRRSTSSRYDQVVQCLSTTMKMVAKGILKDHLVPVASSTTCSGNLNGFNNAGYRVTFRPLKVQVPLTESTLFTPMKCLRRLQRDAILILWDVWSHHVRGASMQCLALNHLLRFWNENQLKSNKELDDDLYDFLALVRTDQEKGLDTHSWTMWTTLLKTTRWMISAYHQNWMEHLECLLLNITANIDTSEKGDFKKMTQR